MGKKTKKLDKLSSVSVVETTSIFKPILREAKDLPLYQRTINVLDETGQSLLHWAVRKDSLQAAENFIAKHGDINIRDSNGITAVEWASVLNRTELLIFLIDLGAEIPGTLKIYNLDETKKPIQKQRNSKAKQLVKELPANEEETTLDLSFCFFTRFPPLLDAENTITKLSLCYNNLTKIPEAIFSIKNLRELDLSNNLLGTLSERMSELSLQHFNVSHNQLSNFPSISELSAKWTNLDVSYNFIASIPPEINKLYRLIRFNCSHNHLKELPKSIVEILGMQHLNVSYNYISHLRDIPLHLLSSLETLDLSYNKLKIIPYADIMNSQTIKNFYFSHNKLPEHLYRILKCYFYQDISLDLSALNLTALIPEVTLLTQLQELNLSGNDFDVLPNEIGNLVELTSLDLSYNHFTDLPLFLHRLSKLQSLNLEETRDHIVNPSRGVIDRGLKHLMGYYFDLLQGEPCYRLKLMFVGQENVGKSTLLHALKSFKLRRKTKRSNISTDGIDIERWTLKTGNKQLLTFSAWDFAGQEIYYATHSLFLSSQAIYLIVFDLRHPSDARIEFWLNSVASRATSAPVILIGTHLDAPELEDVSVVTARLEELHKKYGSRFPNIKRISAVSATDYAGIDQLHNLLGEVGLSMPSIQDALPKIYQTLEDLILEVKDKENPPAVDWKKFISIASTVNFKDEDQLLRATHFLNDLGSLVFFEDDITNDRLIVLDPQWLTAMFASVITTSHTYIKQGILKLSSIGQIWRAPQYPPKMHGTLLSLLQKFEIIFPLPEDENQDKQFLIPNLLPEERPPIDLLWLDYDPKSEQFARQYTLEFIPNGMFSKLMVRFLHFADVPLKFWRSGVLAQRGTDKALIELIDKTVFITVRGDTSSEFLRVATEIVDTLISSWFKVTITKAEVPCPHCIKLRSAKPFMFDLLECEQAAARFNARVVTCPTDSSTVRLDRIVPDIAMTDFQGAQIQASEVELEKQIGKGSFGEIFKGKWRGELVAIKRLKVGEDMAVAGFAEFRREVWLMTGLRHPCIVNLKGFSTNPLMMVMECVTGGDLFGMIHNESIDMNWHLRLKLSIDMAYGMAFLHGINPPLLHRDLKSPNVLVMDHAEGTEVIAKIADFGLSSRLFVDVLNDRAVENPTWCAPEVLQNKPYTEKADVYSYGMMLWELLTRELPFDNYKFQYQVEDDVIKGVRPSIPGECWEGFADLIRICWAPEPSARPTFPEIIPKLREIVENEIGMDKFRYPFEPPLTGDLVTQPPPTLSADVLSMRKDRAESLSTTALAGLLTKKIEVTCQGGISTILHVMNQVWCGAKDGSIHIFSVESGRFLTSYKTAAKAILSFASVDNRVWSGSLGQITTWTVDDLVTVDVYDVKIRTGLLMVKPTDRKRFASKKLVPRYCVLYKSGYFRVYKNQGDEEPIQEFFLKDCEVLVSQKNRLVITEGERECQLEAKTDVELHTWFSEFSIVLSQFNEIPSAQESVRRVCTTGDKITAILPINENCIFIACGSSVFVLDSKARIKDQIKLAHLFNGVEVSVTALLDNGTHLWVAAENEIIRINCATNKILNVLTSTHEKTVNSMLRVDDEVWVASDDGISIWEGKSGKFICFASRRPKFAWRCLVETSTAIWAGTASGVIILFDRKTKQERGQVKQHKGAVNCMALVIGGLVWSCSAENEICIWK